MSRSADDERRRRSDPESLAQHRPDRIVLARPIAGVTVTEDDLHAVGERLFRVLFGEWGDHRSQSARFLGVDCRPDVPVLVREHPGQRVVTGRQRDRSEIHDAPVPSADDAPVLVGTTLSDRDSTARQPQRFRKRSDDPRDSIILRGLQQGGRRTYRP